MRMDGFPPRSQEEIVVFHDETTKTSQIVCTEFDLSFAGHFYEGKVICWSLQLTNVVILDSEDLVVLLCSSTPSYYPEIIIFQDGNSKICKK
jgi:hypothetical protein